MTVIGGVTDPDDEHSETEPRWITLGRDASGRYVLVVHTFERIAGNRERIRMDLSETTNAIGNPRLRGRIMKPEYDFKKGERGKFFHPDSDMRNLNESAGNRHSWPKQQSGCPGCVGQNPSPGSISTDEGRM